MQLVITATGEQAELEECVDAGYYLRIAGHARFFATDQVTHPAPACPQCGGELGSIQLRAAGNRYHEYASCTNTACDYQRRKA